MYEVQNRNMYTFSAIRLPQYSHRGPMSRSFRAAFSLHHTVIVLRMYTFYTNRKKNQNKSLLLDTPTYHGGAAVITATCYAKITIKKRVRIRFVRVISKR